MKMQIEILDYRGQPLEATEDVKDKLRNFIFEMIERHPRALDITKTDLSVRVTTFSDSKQDPPAVTQPTPRPWWRSIIR